MILPRRNFSSLVMFSFMNTFFLFITSLLRTNWLIIFPIRSSIIHQLLHLALLMIIPCQTPIPYQFHLWPLLLPHYVGQLFRSSLIPISSIFIAISFLILPYLPPTHLIPLPNIILITHGLQPTNTSFYLCLLNLILNFITKKCIFLISVMLCDSSLMLWTTTRPGLLFLYLMANILLGVSRSTRRNTTPMALSSAISHVWLLKDTLSKRFGFS